MTNEPKAAPQDAPDKCPFCGDSLVPEDDCGIAVWTHPRRNPRNKCIFAHMVIRKPLIAAWNTRTAVSDTALAKARDDALEEAALWCDEYSKDHGAGMFDRHSNACANGTRALKGKTDE